VGLVIAVVLFGGACSSSKPEAAPPTSTTTTTTLPPKLAPRPVEVVVDPIFRQGVAKTDTGWAFSFNNGLYLTDEAFKITKRVQPAIPVEWTTKGYDHLGDIDVQDGVLYAPLERPSRAGGQAVLWYDATSLAFQGGVDVAQHHASFVTVDGTTAYSMDFFDDTALTRYDIANGWKPLAPIKLSRVVQRVQGADVRDGFAYLSTDDPTDGVYRVDLETGKVLKLGDLPRPVEGEGEGIDATPTAAGELHVLSASLKIVPVWLVQLKLD
jgi:hypothetical protein